MSTNDKKGKELVVLCKNDQCRYQENVMPRFVIEEQDKREGGEWRQVDGYDERSMAHEQVKEWRKDRKMRFRVRDTQSPIVVEAEWTDDHRPCVNLRVGEKHVSLWWTNSETVSALRYAQRCKQAREAVRSLLNTIVNLKEVKHEEGDSDAAYGDNGYTPYGFIDKPYVEEAHENGTDQQQQASGVVETVRRHEGEDGDHEVRYQWGDTSTILLSERDRSILIDAMVYEFENTGIDYEEGKTTDQYRTEMEGLDGKTLVLEGLTGWLELPFRKED